MNKLTELFGPLSSDNIDAILNDIKSNKEQHGIIVSRSGQYFYVQKLVRGDQRLSLQEIMQKFIAKSFEEQVNLPKLRLRNKAIKEILDRKKMKLDKMFRVVKFFYDLIWNTTTTYNKEVTLLKELDIKLIHPQSSFCSSPTSPSKIDVPLTFTSDSPHILFRNKKIQFSEDEISHDYKVDGSTIADQTIYRFNSLDEDIQFCQSMIGFLTEKIRAESLKTGEDQAIILTQLESKLNFYVKQLAHAQHLKIEGRTWLNSNYFRHLIKKLGNYIEAVKQYIAAPINMRYQELKIAGKKAVGFFRLGIISDMRNGWVSIKDLQMMRDNPEFVQKIIKRIAANWRSSKYQKDAADYARLQLISLIYKKDTKEAVEAVNQNALNSLIEERRCVLEKQMLHLLNAQIEKNLEQIKDSFKSGNKREFNLVHLALLNPKKIDFHKSGWMHDERVEIEDMQAIFEAFRGKTLIFNGSGLKIDGDNIYLPYKLDGVRAEEARVNLNTYFFNISTQGYMKNKGMQLELNTRELDRLTTNSPNLFQHNQVLLDQLKDNSHIPSSEEGYPIAEDFMMILLKLDLAGISVGCLSAKDRTGLISERIMLQYLPKDYKDHPVLRKQIFDINNPPVKVVLENTGARSLKINPKANVRGYNIAEKMAILFRTVSSSD